MDAFDRPDWSLLQVLAWVFTRDPEAVRQCADDAERQTELVQVTLPDGTKKIVNKQMDRPGLGWLGVWAGNHEIRIMPYADAEAQLVDAFRRGRLHARGIANDVGNLRPIPPEDWADLKIMDGSRGGAYVTAKDHFRPGATVWKCVSIERAQVLALWPEQSATAADTTSPDIDPRLAEHRRRLDEARRWWRERRPVVERIRCPLGGENVDLSEALTWVALGTPYDAATLRAMLRSNEGALADQLEVVWLNELRERAMKGTLHLHGCPDGKSVLELIAQIYFLNPVVPGLEHILPDDANTLLGDALAWANGLPDPGSIPRYRRVVFSRDELYREFGQPPIDLSVFESGLPASADTLEDIAQAWWDEYQPRNVTVRKLAHNLVKEALDGHFQFPAASDDVPRGPNGERPARWDIRLQAWIETLDQDGKRRDAQSLRNWFNAAKRDDAAHDRLAADIYLTVEGLRRWCERPESAEWMRHRGLGRPKRIAARDVEETAPPLVDPYRTGAPGRPKASHLVLAEFNRRVLKGEVLRTLAGQARDLKRWFDAAHSGAPTLTERSIRNTIREEYNGAADPSRKRPAAKKVQK